MMASRQAFLCNQGQKQDDRYPPNQSPSIASSTTIKDCVMLEAAPINYSRMTKVDHRPAALPELLSFPELTSLTESPISTDQDLACGLANLSLKSRLPPGCSLTPKRLIAAEMEVARQYVPADYSPIPPVPPTVNQIRRRKVPPRKGARDGRSHRRKKKFNVRRHVRSGFFSHEMSRKKEKDTPVKLIMKMADGLKVMKAVARVSTSASGKYGLKA